ncbi:SRPBCC domain-containing protein [Sulfidibacter corallicola]|uniref:SRPBCC domain-containing protein n=1 Tax=Sulfidibacter corallicola TaxID=2818388 RepID=A0A8A4TIX0_SULCO|nr:SRPBCC domain-containing protein [Sulfidibacter corallicola]QTD49437.1 SRPBCC domain-containing protein [Sulfidibacter corallicola]
MQQGEDRPSVIRHATIELEVHFPSERGEVWNTLTNHMPRWIPKTYYSLPTSKRMVFERKIGGNVYEAGDHGSGLVWFQITAMIPDTHIAFKGYLFPAWGGPGVSFLTFDLSQTTSGCKLLLTDQAIGVITADTENTWRNGWKDLITNHLYPYLINFYNRVELK